MRKKLTDMCTIQYGYAFDSKEFTDNSNFPQLVRIRDVKRGYSETFFRGKYSLEYIIHTGDLLIGMDGEFNIARWRSGDALLNQRVCKVTVKEDIDEEYLRFSLSRALKQIENRTSFVTVKHLSTKELNSLELECPNIQKQKEISDRLVKIEEIISLRQQQLAKLDELVKARFVETFGDSEYNTKHWPVVKLSDICEVGSSKRIYKNEQSSSGVPFLRISDLNERIDGKIKNPEIFISIEKYDELKLQGMVPIAGDVLVTSRGTLGRCYIVTEEDVFYFQDGMISWLSKIDARAASLYLSYLFSMRGIQKQIETLQAGSTVAYLSITMLKKLDIMLPPPELQRRFLSFAEQIDKLKLSIKKSLEQMETLKKALMQQYFG